MKSEFKARLAAPVQLIGETARAIGFLSRIPLPSRFFAEEDGPLSETVRAFPIAGLAIALPSAVLLAILAATASPALMAGFLVVALQIAITGGLHEDGLADSADGQGAGNERERILAAMKDSRIGTFGTIALILSIGIRAAAVATLAAAATPFAAMFAYLGIAAASRAAMVWHWQALPAARADGVAAAAGRPHETATNWAIAIGVSLFVLCLVPALGVLPGAAILIAMAAATAAFTRHVDVKIAGHTGDTIGAAQQVAEIVGLVALVLFL